MKKFTFRFQTLLNTKEHLEELKKNELAVLLGRLRVENERLTEMVHSLADCRDEYIRRDNGTVAEIQKYSEYFDKLGADIAKQKQVIANTETEVEDKRKELIAVQKERLALDRLKQKDYAKYMKELALWERKFLDEIGSNAFARALTASNS